ncbi:MAG: TIGR03643 family protein [Methylophilaceae bacterium]
MKLKAKVAIDPELIEQDKSRIIEMAWEDKTTFDVIQLRYGLDENALKKLMKQWLTFGSYKLWRKRVRSKSCKHLQLRTVKITRAYSPTQYKLPN